jgi:DNA-binding NtrC family response regulator
MMLREGSRIDVEVTSSDCEPGSEGLRSTTANVRMVGSSAPIRRVLALVHKLAPRDLTVLITGETGTGKELVARLLHEKSARRREPFVRVNCGAIPASLAESELFGHERGSFTGAMRSRRGYFGMADGGTLLLDEVESLPPDTQPKVLRALEEGEIQTVGSGLASHVDVRVVACTNMDLEEGIAAGWFRADLYYRLAVVRIDAPPLRDRREDIAALANHFAQAAGVRFGIGAVTLTEAAVSALEDMPWPGNVRQLENLVTSMVALADGAELDETALRGGPRPALHPGEQMERPSGAASLQEQMDAVERRIIQEALASCMDNRSEAARRLKVSRTTMLDRMRKLGLQGGGTSLRSPAPG